MLDCSGNIDGMSYLNSDFTVVCGDAKHTAHVVVAVIVLAGFCLGLPAFCGISVSRIYKSGELHSVQARKLWLFMTHGYRDKRAWWESIVQLRKLVVVSIVATRSSGQHQHQVYAATLVLVLCLAAQLILRPYADKEQGFVENASLVTSCLSLYAGLLFGLGELSEATVTLAAAVILLANVAFLLLCAYIIARDLRRNGAHRKMLSAVPFGQSLRKLKIMMGSSARGGWHNRGHDEQPHGDASAGETGVEMPEMTNPMWPIRTDDPQDVVQRTRDAVLAIHDSAGHPVATETRAGLPPRSPQRPITAVGKLEAATPGPRLARVSAIARGLPVQSRGHHL